MTILRFEVAHLSGLHHLALAWMAEAKPRHDGYWNWTRLRSIPAFGFCV